jgi:hypothetical protein
LLPGVTKTAFGLDIFLEGGVGNLSFDTGAQAPLSGAGRHFEPYYFPFGKVGITDEFNDIISYRAVYERDSILKNKISADICFDIKFLHMEFGPLISPLNTSGKYISPGIEASLGMKFPGILFGNIRGASTLGSSLSFGGDYIQESGGVDLGFWVSNAICTLSADTKSFTERVNDILTIRDELSRYQLGVDFFSKNVPYTMSVDLGYQNLKRSYVPAGGAQGSTLTDELHSIYAGLEVSCQINPLIRLIFGGEAPFYSWGEKPLKSPEKGDFLFQTRTGLVISLR